MIVSGWITCWQETLWDSVSGQLSETFQLLIKSQQIFITQTSSLDHLIARCLVSLETEFQFRDAFRHKMTAKILEHVISELSDSFTFLHFPEDKLSDRPLSSSYNFAVSDWVI